jgi:hypothetical protein
MEHHTEYDDDSDRMYGHTSVAPRTLGKRWTGLRFVIEMFVLLHVVISKVASIRIWRISFVSHTRPLTPSKAKPLGRSGFRPASQLVVMRAKYVSAKIFFIEMRRAAFLSKGQGIRVTDGRMVQNRETAKPVLRRGEIYPTGRSADQNATELRETASKRAASAFVFFHWSPSCHYLPAWISP